VRRLCPLLLLLLMTGCAHGPGPLVRLRGQSVLLVGEAGDDAELRRSLARVPLRIYPTEADAALLAELGAGPTGAREPAEARRLPWLVVVDADGVRVETGRGGRVLWRDAANGAAIRDALLRALRVPGEKLDRGSRLADQATLDGLRALALAGDFAAWSTAAQRAAQTWPADPAVRCHEALPEALGTAAKSTAAVAAVALEPSRGLNPEGEHELLALALLADDSRQPGLARLLRELLVALHPDRLDYRPELAHARAKAGDDAGAADAALAARSAAGDLPRGGGSPDEDPRALPQADAAYTAAWYLARRSRWELAALEYEAAAAVYGAFGRPGEQGDALNGAGVVLMEAGRSKLAAARFGRAVVLREKHPGPSTLLADTRYNLARAQAESGDLAAALITYHRAAREYVAAGEVAEALDARLETLDVLIRRDDPVGLEEAVAGLLEELAELAGPQASRVGELTGWTWFELGRGRQRFLDAEGSLAAYNEALGTWQRLGRRLEEGQALYSRAIPHVAMLRFDEAFADLLAALTIAVELADSTSILAIRGQLADLERLATEAGQPLPKIPEDLARYLE